MKWFPEVYGDSENISELDIRGVHDLIDITPGETTAFCEEATGSFGHRSMVIWLPLLKLNNGFGIKIMASKVCHSECQVAVSYWASELKADTKKASCGYGHAAVDMSKIRMDTAAEMRAWYGLSPASEAGTEKDVL